MKINFILPKISEGELEIYRIYTPDSSSLIYFKSFYADTIISNIQMPYEDLKHDPVFKYAIFTEGTNYESFIQGNTDDLVVDVSRGQSRLNPSNKLYQFSKMSDNYDGSDTQKQLVINELNRLYRNHPWSEYIGFIVYSAIANNLLSPSEFYRCFKLTEHKTKWVNSISEILATKESLPEYFKDTFLHLCHTHEFILLKFWASWCKPCLEDDVYIRKILKRKGAFPFVIGVENDEYVTKELPYLNILDRDQLITQYYQINSYPTYLLFRHGELDFRANSIRAIKSYFRKKK